MKAHRIVLFAGLLAGMVATLFFTGSAGAQTFTWGGGSNGTWDFSDDSWGGTGSNTLWNSVNSPSNIAAFNTGGATANVSGAVYTNGIVFNNTATINNGTVNLAGNMPTITTNANGTINSTLAGNAGLIVQGSGILRLGNANTYTGGTTVNSGTLALEFNQGDLPTGTLAAGSTVNVNNGGTLRLDIEDALGYSYGIVGSLNIAAGGVVTSLANQNFRVTLPTVYFTGGTLSSGANNGGDGAGNYLIGTINAHAAGSTAIINAGTLSGNSYFNVASGSTPSGVDLAVSSNLEGFFGGYGGLEKEGAGKMVYTGIASNMGGGQVLIGQFLAGGTLEFGSGANVNTTGRFNVGGGNSAASGVVTVDSGAGTLTFGGDGGGSSNFIGVDSGSGTMNVNGGVVNFGPLASTGSVGYLRVGSNSNATGLLKVTGGAVNIGTAASLNGFYDNSYYAATSSNATLTISGGNVNIGTSTATATNGTIGTLYLSNNGGGSGSATVNLNGGVLSLAQIVTGNSGMNTINLNGGTLQANSSAQGADFLDPSSALNVYVGANTSTIDTQANNITISSPLLHGGASPDGGLIKVGAGTLTLSGANTFNGNVVVDGGSLVANVWNDVTNPINGALGNPQVARTVTVNSGAMLLLNQTNVLGNSISAINTALVVNGGTVSYGNTGNMEQTLGLVTLSNGAVLNSINGGAAGWQAYALTNTVNVSGSSGSFITSTGTTNVADNLQGNITFNVASTGGSGPDLTVLASLADATWGLGGTGAVTKTGNGVMVLSNSNTYSGGTTVNGGTLRVTNGSALGSGTVSIGASGTLTFDTSGGNIIQTGTTITGAGALNVTGGNSLGFGSLGNVNVQLSADAQINVQSGVLDSSYYSQGYWYNNQASLNVASGAIFYLKEHQVVVDALTGGGTVHQNWPLSDGYPASLVVGIANGSGNFSGIIEDGYGAASVIKTGSGTQAFSNALSSFTGNLTINSGTVAAVGQSNPYNPTTSPLGNPQTPGRQIIVNSTGTLLFNAGSDSLGNAGSTPQVQIVVNNGGNVISQNALTTLVLQRYTHDVTHDVATTYINSTLIARLAVSSFAVTTYGEHVAL